MPRDVWRGQRLESNAVEHFIIKSVWKVKAGIISATLYPSEEQNKRQPRADSQISVTMISWVVILEFWTSVLQFDIGLEMIHVSEELVFLPFLWIYENREQKCHQRTSWLTTFINFPATFHSQDKRKSVNLLMIAPPTGFNAKYITRYGPKSIFELHCKCHWCLV